MKKIILYKGKEKSLHRYHPWVFSGAIQRKDLVIKDGDMVEVWDADNHYLATGHFFDSSIAVRIFSFQKITPDMNYWRKKIESAIYYRKVMGLIENPQTNMYRLINGEGDGMPGFIADWFNGHLVIQFHSYGMYLLKEVFVQILNDIFKEKIISIFDKSSTTMPEIKGHHFKDELITGNVEEVIVSENGHRFHIDILKGQKTGFFIDQRDNRKLVSDYAKSKKVLNLFCYTGGFSVYAAAAGATEVHSVDISRKAIELTEKNINLLPEKSFDHQSFSENVFDFLEEIPDRYYDLIILDPPAFAKHHKVKDQGIKGYRNINRKVFEKIKEGGLLFTFSCSQAISKDDFQTLLFSSAVMEKREITVVKSLQQSMDHPVNIYHPEGSYLKGFMLYAH